MTDVAKQLIKSVVGEGKAAMFDDLKNGDVFVFPGKKSKLEKETYTKVNSGRAKNTSTGVGIDVLPSDFVLRWP